MSTQTLSHRHVASRPNPFYNPGGTPAVATSTVVSTKWQLDFSAAVQVVALPTDFTVAGQPPVSFVQNSPTRVTLTFATSVATGQSYVIPSRSLNIRTATGGFVAAATGTF
jgi:hypothetical protein